MNTFLIVGSICAGFHAADVDPADARIRYTGRWEFSDPSAPWCTWQGSSITAKFRGTGIQGDFENGTGSEFVRVLIDGNATAARKIKLSPTRQTYTLAAGLEPGEHQVEIIKETYTSKGRLTFHGFQVAGDGLLEITGPRPKLRIEFYGDSNLAGVSLEHEKNDGDPSLRGSYYGFAGIASRMLNAEYHNISSGGAEIAGGINSGMSFYDRLDFFQAEPRWDSDKFPADICVVNLGANDIGSKTKDQIKQDYKKLINALHHVHPEAHVVLMNGYGWSRKEPANYTDEVVEELHDTRLSRVVFPWLFNEWHGCEYDHAGMAQNLVSHLASVNPKWKQVRPLDVMDGFGRDGNVANSGFEEVAHFGGYGWRYHTDGALRVHDPRTSPDGEWFLRLPEGRQVHQPNPAVKETTYTVRVKMRGQCNGDLARIRIEFRDQEWRHEIPNSSKAFKFELDTTWKDYQLRAESPASDESLDASREPWQIIIRLEAKAGTVDFDDVRLSSVRNALVVDVLLQLGAKCEWGTTANGLDAYSSHFNFMDSNRDGKHTRVEYVDNGQYMTPQARAGIFRAADANADGVVTKAEYMLNRIITDEAKTIVQGMDDDEDGLVERVEFVKHATQLLSNPKLAAETFAALDANDDAVIHIPEYLRVWGRWARTGRKSAEERIAACRAALAEDAEQNVRD